MLGNRSRAAAATADSQVTVLAKKHYVVPVGSMPLDRVRRELATVRGMKRLVSSYEQHYSFFDNDTLTLYHQQVLGAEGRILFRRGCGACIPLRAVYWRDLYQ